MSASGSIVARLEAWSKGKPLPRGETLQVPIAEPANSLITVFLRMGGESSPWGIAYGHPGESPVILTVPEPRNRTLVGDMVAKFAPPLLRHFRHPEFDEDSPTDSRGIAENHQLWLANPTHLDMLHFLNYTYTFTKWGDPDRAHLLNALGRLCGWLFREARRPGQATVMVSTDALRQSYTFPSEDVRQAHLGYLLAWLQTKGKRNARLKAAHEAERLSVSTSLDPLIEKDQLEEMVSRWGVARSEAKERVMAGQAKLIERVLAPELERRYQLVSEAIAALASDKRRRNDGLSMLEDASKEELWYQYLRMERRIGDNKDGPHFVASPETDRFPAAASSRYFVHEASEELRVAALIHDDRELQDEAIASGDAIRGPIVEVRDDGTGRRLIPVWKIEIPAGTPLRIREGSWLCVAGLAKRVVKVLAIEKLDDERLHVEVEIIALKTVPRGNPGDVLHADDSDLEGTEVTLLPSSSEGIARRKSQRIWEQGLPGSWLTRAVPAGKGSRMPEEAAEDIDAIVSQPTS